MCNGAESRGNINGEVVISKVENYNEERMQNIEFDERGCNSCGRGLNFLQRIHHHLNSLLPTISVSEVGYPLSLIFLSMCVFYILLI
jgi:hypothetical protein